MEKKNLSEDTNPKETVPAAENAPATNTAAVEDQQIAKLQELVVQLQEKQAQSARNALFEDTVAYVKSAIQQATAAPARVAVPAPTDQRDCCKEEPCGCFSKDCCCFEIVLDKIRATHPQGILEPADSGDTTIPIPTINELEVRLFASIDNIGILIPSLDTTLGLRVPSILAGGGPGLWVSIDKVIGKIYLPKGTTRNVIVEFQGQESEEGAERVVGFKDEYGFATGSITLDCCVPKIYPSMPTDLSFNYGGTGGTMPGGIAIAFYARKVCC